MQEELVRILRCTMCAHSPVELRAGERAGDGEVVAGAIHCPACGRDYPIEDGVPILLPDGPRGVNKNDFEHWLAARKKAEEGLVDEDLRTYKARFQECARSEGIDEARESYLWEQKLYEETIVKFGEHWEQVPEKFGMKWVRTGEGEKARNEAFLEVVRGRERGSAGKFALNVGSGGDTDIVGSLGAMGLRVLNCDIVPDAVKRLGRVYRKEGRPGRFEGLCADLTRLPFVDETLGLVICLEVIHHVRPIEKGLVEAMRVVSPGGAIYLVEVNPRHLFARPGRIIPKPAKRWFRKAIRRLFGARERYVQGSPYEQVMPIDDFASAMTRLGMAGVGKQVVVHAPPVFPAAVIRLWEKAGRRYPRLFDGIAFEFALWGMKPPAGS